MNARTVCATDVVPTEADATNLVSTLRRAGYDMVKLDAVPAASASISVHPQPGEINAWHLFLADCAERKFPVWTELYGVATARAPTAADVAIIDDPATADAWVAAVRAAPDARALFAAAPFDPRLELILIRNLRDWARSFNPHTGRRYADDALFTQWTYTPGENVNVDILPQFFQKQAEQAKLRWEGRAFSPKAPKDFFTDTREAHIRRVFTQFETFGTAARRDVFAPPETAREASHSNAVTLFIPWRGAAEDSYFFAQIAKGTHKKAGNVLYSGIVTNNPTSLGFPEAGVVFPQITFNSIGRETNTADSVKFAATGEVVRIMFTLSVDYPNSGETCVIAFHATDLDDGERLGVSFSMEGESDKTGFTGAYLAYNRKLNLIYENEHRRFRPRPPSEGVFMYELIREKNPLKSLPFIRK